MSCYLEGDEGDTGDMWKVETKAGSGEWARNEPVMFSHIDTGTPPATFFPLSLSLLFGSLPSSSLFSFSPLGCEKERTAGRYCMLTQAPFPLLPLPPIFLFSSSLPSPSGKSKTSVVTAGRAKSPRFLLVDTGTPPLYISLLAFLPQ